MKTRVIIIAMSLLSFLACTQPAEKKEVAVQLYSVRSMIGNPEKYAANHKEVLSGLAEMGYTAVEAANFSNGKFYGRTPEEFKSDVEAAGMKVLSSHTNRKLSADEMNSGDLTEAFAWWDEALPAHKAAGMEYVVVPSMKGAETIAQLQVCCDYLNGIGKRCKDLGMTFGYHNHAFEFNKVEDQVMYDYMIQHTDPELVFFQMDVYWVVIGKASPVEYFKKYPGRFKVLHIKDYREIGQSGMVGFDSIFRNWELAGMDNYVVEVEKFSGDNWVESLSVSANYLLDAPFVKATY